MMKENPFLLMKKERLTQVRKIIGSLVSDGEKIIISKVIAVIVINTGLSKKKAREYLETFIDSEFIEKRGIFIMKKTQPQSPSLLGNEDKINKKIP